MNTEEAIQEILDDLEHQPLQDKRTFVAYLNQPEIISLSSTNGQLQSPPISNSTYNTYYNFTNNLPRPALNTKSLQLLKAIIPQAQCSIPDYSLVFPYYRLRTVPFNAQGEIKYIDKPSFDNLFFVRLLPSYYKKELLLFANQWGYNETFNDYEELATQLVKSCNEDKTFNYSTHYFPEDISITYNKTSNRFDFKGLNTELEPITPPGAPWEVTTYGIDSIVYFGKSFYKCLHEVIDSVVPPPLDTYNWEIYFANSYVPFDPDFTYVVDEVVYDSTDGFFYICIQNTVGSDHGDPSDSPDYWKNVSQFFDEWPFFTSYLIAGYNDPNVDTLLRYVQTKSTTTFNPDNTGDFTFSSIPGQPYVEYQTLARRLGFTWDSTGMISETINDYIDTGILYGSTTALFYNRLRPIPPYHPSVTEFRSSLGALEDSYVYSADGYCNLVYSSIVSIYTTIVGTSSVDTQRNANLLGVIEMNCGNLGIAMANNFINNQLTKIQPDIYSIYIELRDENGEPYYLTNNANTTLVLKLTYE